MAQENIKLFDNPDYWIGFEHALQIVTDDFANLKGWIPVIWAHEIIIGNLTEFKKTHKTK